MIVIMMHSSLNSTLRHPVQCDLRHSGHEKVYLTLNSSTDTIMSALDGNLAPGKTLDTSTRTALDTISQSQ